MRNLICIMLALLPAVSGAAMFRCGNVYQDRPCAEMPGQEIRPSGISVPSGAAVTVPGAGSRPAGSKAAATQFCAQKGQQAEKIVWKREGGASRDDQIAELGSRRGMVNGQELERLIRDVYTRKGSAIEIRGLVEADCMQRQPHRVVEKADAATCAMYRDMRTRQEIQSRAAKNQSQIDLFNQVKREMDDKIADAGC
ncbi:hypothetical protein ACFPOE_22340 [Caenimonas terrae]|uniref:DUF4124 domain-containing protein n=1 Tax=Caenimonas terrae TaxID=696074 RepID=A0ABW0NKP3_9BURK